MTNAKSAVVAIAVAGAWLLTTVSAQAGTIILEGSDAIGLHCPEGNASACTYTAQVWKALDGASGKPIAVIGTGAGVITSQGSGITIDDFASLAAAGSLSQYAAVYFLAGGGCCDEDDTLITAAGAQTAVTNYLAAGGTIMIENYTGGAAWDFAVHAGGAGNAHTGGFDGGLGGFTCSDDETVTADGLKNGFTQPGILGCWTHQAYDESFFGPLGFTLSFFNSPPGLGFPGGPYSSLLSEGTTLTGGGGAPEPASFVLFGAGILALGLIRRRPANRETP